MPFTKSFRVGLEERGLLSEDGVTIRVLTPGVHRFSAWKDVDVKVLSMASPLGDIAAPLVKLLGDDVITVDVADDERAVLLERGVAVRRLGPGRHVLWSHKEPTVETFKVSAAVPLEAMSSAVRTLLAEDLFLVDVGEEDRVVQLKDSVARAILAAGRHAFWVVNNITVARYSTKDVVVELPPAHAALLADELHDVDVDLQQRALVSRRGIPTRLLGTGRHTVWRHKDISVERLAVGGVTATPVAANVRPLMPATDYVEVTVPDGAMGIRFVDGAIDCTLPPGRHAAFTVDHQVSIVSVDLRERIVAVQGQDILTKDKVSLRLNASMSYRVVDVMKLVQGAKNADEILYLTVQLALRQQVAQHTLDELLSERASLAEAIRPAAVERATALGLVLVDFGVKDIILPGEMKALLNKVIEAQKTAESNVILRREETAAVRSMAQTAKVLADNPVLMRLKELEAYKELADKVGTVNVVLTGDGGPKLELKV